MISTSIRLALAVAAVLGVLALVGEASARPARPNIVWIFVEDMNPWMGPYGDDTVSTPHLDALASRGVRFDRVYMPAGVCSATRSALALGAMQTSLGVHNHRSSRQRVPEEVIHLPEGVRTVYELLRQQGYYVLNGGGKNDFNFLWGADRLYDFDGEKIGFHGPDWRRREKDQPFFAQIQLRGGKNTGDVEQHTDPAEVEVMPYYPDHPVMRREIAHHYDCIRQTDDEVGRVIAALQADGLLESTVVFFFTDHGMRLPRHKQWLYDGSIRVPLLVAGPGLPEEAVRDDLVSGIDITVTTLALAGIDRAAWMEGRDVFAPGHEPREFVVSARDRCDYTIERVRAVTTRRYRYLRSFLTDRPFMQPQYRDGRDYVEVPRRLHEEGKLNPVQDFMWRETRVPEELYDLEADPHEIRNLADDPGHAEMLEHHREILSRWIEETDDQGQYPESVDALRGVLVRWSEEAVNPEYEAARDEALAFTVSFDINEELWKVTEWTEPPQLALWLENDTTGAVRTLFVTRRTARDEWEGQSSVPASLPYWVTRYQRELGEERGPTSRDPLPDAVTGATPKLSFSHTFEVEKGEWSLYLEVNVSGDYNEHYQRVVTDGALADFGAGQPSLVYRARDIAGADGPTDMEIIGQTTLAKAPGEGLVEPHHITSAHRLIQNIALTPRRPGD